MVDVLVEVKDLFEEILHKKSLGKEDISAK